MLNDAQGEGISASGLSHRVAWRSDRRVLPTRIIDARLIDHECSTLASLRRCRTSKVQIGRLYPYTPSAPHSRREERHSSCLTRNVTSIAMDESDTTARHCPTS